MKVISVVSTKGGVGKSTIAVNLAAEGSRRDMRVLLIDCDLQKSSLGWRDLRAADDITATSITTPTIHKDIVKFEKAFDLAIIDCGGETASPVLPSAMSAASANGLVVIPVLPSVYDIWATEDTLKILRQVRSVQDVNARFLVNQVMQGRTMSREVNESLDAYSSDVAPLKNQLIFRESYKKTIKDGLGVVEYSDGLAKGELSFVFDEIMEIISAKGGK
jgi:chromosome partitioning protein